MRALIIGGTGNLSLSTTQLLLKKGWEVTLLHRGKSKIPDGAKELIADIKDESVVAQKMGDTCYDSVIEFIAFEPDHVERDFRIFKGKTKQYIFISSASAYQKPVTMLPITESTPLHNPFWQYSRDKAACENVLMQHYYKEDFPVTIVRPSNTYGGKDVPIAVIGDNGCWSVLKRMKEGKRVLVPGDGSSLWAMTHSDDLAFGIVGLMGNPHALGQAVHITSDELLCWDEIYRCIASALSVEYKPAYVPSDLLDAAGRSYGYDYKGRLTGDKACSVIFDNSKIKSLVPDFCTTIRIDQGLRAGVEYFLTNPEVQKEDPVFDAFSDRVIEAMDGVRDALSK